jgi:hypothetical protein
MMHAKYLCQMPQVRKGDASALRHLINRVKSHERTQGTVAKCNISRLNVKSFDASIFG